MLKRIYIPCPLCAHDSTNPNHETWTHGGQCGGVLYADEYAYVHCSQCGMKAHISEMYVSCDCGKHSKIIPNRDDIASSFCLAKMGITDNSIKWYKSFVNHL